MGSLGSRLPSICLMLETALRSERLLVLPDAAPDASSPVAGTQRQLLHACHFLDEVRVSRPCYCSVSLAPLLRCLTRKPPAAARGRLPCQRAVGDAATHSVDHNCLGSGGVTRLFPATVRKRWGRPVAGSCPAMGCRRQRLRGHWRREHLGCALPTSPPYHCSVLPLQ